LSALEAGKDGEATATCVHRNNNLLVKIKRARSKSEALALPGDEKDIMQLGRIQNQSPVLSRFSVTRCDRPEAKC